MLKNWKVLKMDTDDNGEFCIVEIIAHIKDVVTGEIRQYKTDTWWYEEDWDCGSPSVFLWEEGNYSCDCNRETLFRKAGGESFIGETGCGENRYRVNCQNPVHGEFFYQEYKEFK